MKGTPFFEEVFMRLVGQPGVWLKILVGGLLSFVPVLNFFAFGYLYRFSKSTRETGQVALPAWDDWKGLFYDGLRFGIVWICYWFLPIVIMSLLSGLLGVVGLGAIAWVISTITALFATVLFCSALYRFQMSSDFKELLNIPLIFKMTHLKLTNFVVPALAVLGLTIAALPLYGFAVFFGFLVLIAYTSICFRGVEYRNPAH